MGVHRASPGSSTAARRTVNPTRGQLSGGLRANSEGPSIGPRRPVGNDRDPASEPRPPGPDGEKHPLSVPV
jgi:hypothetical protein